MINTIGIGLASYLNTNSLQPSNSIQPGPAQGMGPFQPGNHGNIVEISGDAMALQEGLLESGMFQNPYSFLAPYGKAGHDSVPQEIQLSKEDQAKVDALNKKLDQIFGVPKGDLSGTEKIKEKELVGAIDKILQKTEPEPLTKAQERQFESIQKGISELFKDGKLTADEEKKLQAFEARIEKLFEGQEPKRLSEADQKALDKLFSQLDGLYGIKQPNKAQIARSEEIFAELDKIYETAANKTAGATGLEGLSKAEQEKANKIFEQIEKLFADAFNPKLNGEDQKQVNAINKQIDDLLGIKPLSDAQTKKVEEIDRQIAKIFEDGNVTAEEEKTLNTLDKQLEEIYGKPRSLSETDVKKLDELFAKLDKVYAKQEQALPQLDFDKLAQFSKELDALIINASKDKDTA